MSFIKILLCMVQAALAFFLALFTLHHAAAQQTDTTKNTAPEFQLPDSTQFQKREIIYVLSGRLLGKGQDKLNQINPKELKDVNMSTSSSEIRNYNGDPKKDIVVFYYTYESEAERKDSIDSHRRKWFGSSIK